MKVSHVICAVIGAFLLLFSNAVHTISYGADLSDAPFKNVQQIIIPVDGQYYTINGVNIPIDEKKGRPIIDENGRVLVPLANMAHMIGEKGIETNWNDKTKTATLYYNGFSSISELKATVGKKELWSRNTGAVTLDSAPQIIGDRTYVPLRPMLNALHIDDSRIVWDGEKREIIIDRTPSFETTEISIYVLGQEETFLINDKNIISQIGALYGQKGDFVKTQAQCDIFLNFNNGTIVGISSKNPQYGYIGNGITQQSAQNLPPEIFDYVKQIIPSQKEEVTISVLEYKLDDNDYGGIYEENNKFYIMTVNKQNVESVVNSLGIENKVEYIPAVFSKKQLAHGFSEIWEKQNELGLYEGFTDIKENKVVVYTEEITDQLIDFIASISDSKCITVVEKPKIV